MMDRLAGPVNTDAEPRHRQHHRLESLAHLIAVDYDIETATSREIATSRHICREGADLGYRTLDAVICPCDRERPPSFPAFNIYFFFLFVFFFIFISSCIFQSLLAPSHLDWGNSSWYNQNQTHSTRTRTGRNGKKERTWRGEKDREEEKKRNDSIFLLSFLVLPLQSLYRQSPSQNEIKKKINK